MYNTACYSSLTLQQNGYHTAHSGKWHVLGREISRGFEVLYDGKRKILASAGEIYDNSITYEAVHFLRKYEDNKPFFLQTHYVNPHDICEYLHSFEDLQKNTANLVEHGIISEEELPPLPPNFNYDEEETVLQIVCRRVKDALVHERIKIAIEKWTDIEWRCYLYYYYRLVEKVDKEIGCLLNAIKSSKYKDNTVILFTVDHGEGCAKHQMFQKFTLYEESIKVPFCISTFSDILPIKKGVRDTKHYVSGVDIFKTVCDIANIIEPKNIQGYSLFPLALGKDVELRDFTYVESNYFGRAIIKGKYKLITEYKPDIDHPFRIINSKNNKFGRFKLFNLENDKYETKNIADQYPNVVDEYVTYLKEMETELHQREIINENGKNILLYWVERINDYWNQIEK